MVGSLNLYDNSAMRKIYILQPTHDVMRPVDVC
jgi:hypothetical protein